ncbi:MAG: hypothetical protein IT299_07000 [Dehalococcoidia bacterium]|nr:hypothetical protein [Dehalococcoidia bacterium]
MARLRRLDFEALAGLIAAVTALVLHLLHVADEGLLLAIILVILALILLRDMRREDREEQETRAIEHAITAIADIRAAVLPADTVLIGPTALREESARFSQRARGEMVWFNVCLSMFEPQALFDVLLRPAIENPRVSAVRFVLDEGERERWEAIVLPKVAVCEGAASVAEPIWTTLDESVSCILADTDAGGVEALLSFWGEPFMARSAGRDVPRYIFHVQRHSELIGRLRELERNYRLAGSR